MQNSLADFAKQQAIERKKEIFSFTFKGQKYWLKKARATKANTFHKIAYRLLPLELLIPGRDKNPQEALKFETKKLKMLLKSGINVPKILYEDNSLFLLEDSGSNIHQIFKDPLLSKEDFNRLTDKSISALAELHNKNLFHGGSQTRNFTTKNDNIYMIDFEESFDENISIQNLQFRDFLLYLLSFAKIKHQEVDYEYIINKYSQLTSNTSFKAKLSTIINRISLLIKIAKFKMLYKFLGSDAKNFIKLCEQIKNIQKETK